jgi:hypothetical protein
MKIHVPCPSCGLSAEWEVDLAVERELAWREGSWPIFGFVCVRCHALLHLAIEWRVEPGGAPRPLFPWEGGGGVEPPAPRLVLVARCPHGCDQALGFRLEPRDPAFLGPPLEGDEELVLGGYRCPRCDGEGRLILCPTLELAPPLKPGNRE